MASFENGCNLQVTVTIDPANLPKFFEHMRPVWDKVVAEPECVFFEIYQNPENPGELNWVESWSKDPEWLRQVQLPKPYYADYLAATEAMFIKPREFKICSRVKGYFYTG